MTTSVHLDDDDVTYVDDDGAATERQDQPRDLYTLLRQKVIGQDRALRSFSVAAWRHKMGLRQGAVLITGPTGTGKTLLAKAYADHADIPIVHVNSTALVAEGIKGLTMGGALLTLHHEAQRDRYPTHRYVLVIDEVDKLGSNPYANAIEHSLLSILDGTPWRSFPDEKQPQLPGGCFRTNRLLVVLLGSYTAVRQEHAQRVGFATASQTSLPDISLDEMIPLDDLRGRIAMHVQVQPHSRKSLMSILNAAEGPMQTLRDCLPQWYVFLADETKERIVAEALAKGLGARYLWTQVDTLSEAIVFDPPKHPGIYDGIVIQPRAA